MSEKVMPFSRSTELFTRSSRTLVGGVNSPVRSFRAVEHEPIIITASKGAYLEDVDGNIYVDLICCWGAQILGHNNEEVLSALLEQLSRGVNYGLTSEKEMELAEIIAGVFHSIEKIRFVNSGTEATATAVRLVRGYTGRKKIIMFEGCYHGHLDYTLTKAGSGLATYSIPKSSGIPEEAVMHTITLNYNEPENVQEWFRKHGDETAAVIVEPIAGNMGVVKPKPDFLRVLREETDKHDALLIFDEVITGFRVRYGGAQHIYGITPDLTCLGKVIGGGLPIGAVGGREDVMSKLTPMGPVYQAGTFSGNPLSMTAGIATLKQLSPQKYEILEERAAMLEEKVTAILKEHGVGVVANRRGSMMTFFFTKNDYVENYEDTLKCDRNLFAEFFSHMLSKSVLLPPSQFESIFLTLSHTDNVIGKIVSAASEAASKIVGESNA